jgi:hypothetical protein
VTPPPAPAFDACLFADYSGASGEAAQRAAIALFRMTVGDRFPRRVGGPYTRETLRERVLAELMEATGRRERLLFGFDHQFSWPIDMWRAAGLDDRPWRRALRALVRGSSSRQGHRPALGPPATFARAFNDARGAPVFYSRVRSLARAYGIPSRNRWNGDPIRLTERAMPGAKPANRLGGAGAVAGQTIEGLRQLLLLLEGAERAGIRVSVWPFDDIARAWSRDPAHVACEVYPGFCKRELGERGLIYRVPEMTDHDADAAAVCVWTHARVIQRNDRSLFDLSDAPAYVRRCARVEGWILGARARDVWASPVFPFRPGVSAARPSDVTALARATRAVARTSASAPKRSRS